jgi:predicted aldo/keto reductase-like oxidoreductase
MGLPERQLGRTGVNISILGLGGEGILRTYGNDKEAYRLIRKAIDVGITYFESARAYSGSEQYYGLALREHRKNIFLASKSHARTMEGAMKHLQDTLRHMKTDYLDLWQVHDVRTAQDISEISGKDGALEAFSQAKDKGMARFIGVTGHHDPAIIRKCLDMFDFDTLLIPVNPSEPHYKSFIEGVLSLALKRQMGIIGMKAYCRGMALRIPGIRSPEIFFRFAASQKVSTVVIGCDDVSQVEENARFASSFKAMTKAEENALIDLVSPYHRSLMYYKP